MALTGRLGRLLPSVVGRCNYSRIARSSIKITEPQGSSIDLDVFGGEKIIPDPIHTQTEVIESREEFRFVEKLLPLTTVPEPPVHTSYPTPSGWVPQRVSVGDLPYFVRRTRFHNFPVYLESLQGGNRKMTVIQKVQGDIWQFEAELRTHLEEKIGKKMYTQVDEVCRKLRVRGLHVEDVADFLLQKGL